MQEARLVFTFILTNQTLATAWHSVEYIQQWYSEIQPSPAYTCEVEYRDSEVA